MGKIKKAIDLIPLILILPFALLMPLIVILFEALKSKDVRTLLLFSPLIILYFIFCAILFGGEIIFNTILKELKIAGEEFNNLLSLTPTTNQPNKL